MVRPERFELPAFWFVAKRSIQLSYGRLEDFPRNLIQIIRDLVPVQSPLPYAAGAAAGSGWGGISDSSASTSSPDSRTKLATDAAVSITKRGLRSCDFPPYVA